MNNPILEKSFEADANINDYRIVKRDTADNLVIQAAANTDHLLGVVGGKGQSTGYTAVDGDPIDVILCGIADCTAGGVFTAGQRLTSDANGKAVAITAAMMLAGQVYSIGYAIEDAGADGDVVGIFVAPQLIPKANAPAGVTYTIGAEASNVINVAAQLTDADGTNLAVAASLLAYFSDDAAGQVAMTTGHSTAPAIGTDGLLQALVAKKVFLATFEADGNLDMDLTETSALTTYLNVVLPDGSIATSAAITHAA